MDVDALGASPVGQLVPITGTDERLRSYDYFAFLPAPLPEVPDLTASAWSAVAQATGALGQLKQACSHLPNPKLLIQPALMREALDTSALARIHRLTLMRDGLPEEQMPSYLGR